VQPLSQHRDFIILKAFWSINLQVYQGKAVRLWRIHSRNSL